MSVESERAIIAEDTAILHKMGYAQELSRRMGGFSNFAVAFSIICILAGGITSFQAAFSGTGPGGVFIGWIIGSAFALIVSVSMAQIASAYPTAGALYHWSSILGGRGWGWATALVNLLGLIFVVASVNVGAYDLFTSLILGNIFHIDTSHWGFWQQTVAVVLITVSQGMFNHMGIRTTTRLTDFSGYLIFFIAAVLIIAMLVGAQHYDFSRLVTFTNYSGKPGGDVLPPSHSLFYLFLLGLLLPLLSILGVGVLIFIGIQPPNDILINYGLGLIVLILVLWFGVARTRFPGPPIGDQIAARMHEIAIEEQAIQAAPGAD